MIMEIIKMIIWQSPEMRKNIRKNPLKSSYQRRQEHIHIPSAWFQEFHR